MASNFLLEFWIGNIGVQKLLPLEVASWRWNRTFALISDISMIILSVKSVFRNKMFARHSTIIAKMRVLFRPIASFSPNVHKIQK